MWVISTQTASHETHVLSIDSLCDSFGIKEVVLVGLHKWPHELSWNELHVMALFTQSTTKKVRSGACLRPVSINNVFSR